MDSATATDLISKLSSFGTWGAVLAAILVAILGIWKIIEWWRGKKSEAEKIHKETLENRLENSATLPDAAQKIEKDGRSAWKKLKDWMESKK